MTVEFALFTANFGFLKAALEFFTVKNVFSIFPDI